MTEPADRESLRVGVIGNGVMGGHHARLLSELPGVRLAGLCDVRREAAEGLASRYRAAVFGDVPSLLAEVDAVVVAAPTSEHARLVCQALDAGRHVLVEKPMATNLAEADRMVQAARGSVLGVGHVEFYNPAVQALLRVAGVPRFVEVERISAFTPRSLDVDVILDLMIHDLQIVQALDPSALVEVRAVGVDVLTPRVDIASARLRLASGCVVNLTASRVSDQTVRRLRVFLARDYYSLDYRDQAIKGFRLARDGGGPDLEDPSQAIVPVGLEVEKAEPLRRELEAFVRVCRGEPSPWVDGAAGRQALATALAVRAAVEEGRPKP